MWLLLTFIRDDISQILREMSLCRSVVIYPQKQPPKVFCKKRFLKNSQNSQKNTCVFFLVSCSSQVCNFIKKETVAQMFSGEFYEISFLQNTTTSLLLLQVQGPKITNKISKILGVHTLLINTAFYKKI